MQHLGDDQPGVYDNKEGLGLKDYRHKVYEQGRGADRIGVLTRDESIYSNTKKESAEQNPDLVYTQEGVYDNPAQLTGTCVCLRACMCACAMSRCMYSAPDNSLTSDNFWLKTQISDHNCIWQDIIPS